MGMGYFQFPLMGTVCCSQNLKNLSVCSQHFKLDDYEHSVLCQTDGKNWKKLLCSWKSWSCQNSWCTDNKLNIVHLHYWYCYNAKRFENWVTLKVWFTFKVTL